MTKIAYLSYIYSLIRMHNNVRTTRFYFDKDDRSAIRRARNDI